MHEWPEHAIIAGGDPGAWRHEVRVRVFGLLILGGPRPISVRPRINFPLYKENLERFTLGLPTPAAKCLTAGASRSFPPEPTATARSSPSPWAPGEMTSSDASARGS